MAEPVKRVTFKLYASLTDLLPAGAKDHQVAVEVAAHATIQQVIDRYQIPPKMQHLVLLNGVYIEPEARNAELADGDTLAVWPPVAGG